MAKSKKNNLSPLENRVMNVIWQKANEAADDKTEGVTSPGITAEEVRNELSTKSQPMKDSTVRTILRRLEQKGYVKHTVEGRTYVYSPTVESQNVATDAVRGIIERFCDGSVEDLLVGMVNDDVVSADKLKELAQRIAKAEKQRNRGEGE